MEIINGQLWIDKNSPYRLKYTANDNIYTVDVSTDHYIKSDDIQISEDNKLYAGTVVAFNNGGIRRAIYPDDIDNVIGVVGNTITSIDQPVSILKTGIISLTKDDIPNILIGSEDFSDIISSDASKMKGAPVYWYIGEEYKKEEDNKIKYGYSYDGIGKISLLTPTGRRWRYINNSIDSIDPSLNVSYDNLPIIGFIDSINFEENTSKSIDTIKSIDIYLNVTKFDTTLEWSWPFIKNNGSFLDENGILTIRHGLFPNSFKDSDESYNFRQRNFCTIIALDSGTNSDNEYEVSANVQDYYGQIDEENRNSDQRTEIYNLSGAYRYRIAGTINLKFDRDLIQSNTNGEQNG